MIKAGKFAQPLLNILNDRLLEYPAMHCGETTVLALKDLDKTAARNSTCRSGSADRQRNRLYCFIIWIAVEALSSVNHQIVAKAVFQTNNYAGYSAVILENKITQPSYWKHARQKIIEAQKVTSGKNNKTRKADIIISMITKYYVIEHKTIQLNIAERHLVRQQENLS